MDVNELGDRAVMDECDNKTLLLTMNERLQVVCNELYYMKDYIQSNIHSITNELHVLKNHVTTLSSLGNSSLKDDLIDTNDRFTTKRNVKTSSELKSEAIDITERLINWNENEARSKTVEKVKESFQNNLERELYIKESIEFVIWLNESKYCRSYALLLISLIKNEVIGPGCVLDALAPMIKQPYDQMIEILSLIINSGSITLSRVKWKLQNQQEDFIQQLETSLTSKVAYKQPSNAAAIMMIQNNTTLDQHIQTAAIKDVETTEDENIQQTPLEVKEESKDLHFSQIEEIAKETLSKLITTKNPDYTLEFAKPLLTPQYYHRFLATCLQEMFTNINNPMHTVFGEFVVKLIETSGSNAINYFINALNYVLELLNTGTEFLEENWLNVAEILCPPLITGGIKFSHIKQLYLNRDYRSLLSNVFKCLLKTEEKDVVKNIWNDSKTTLELFMGKNQVYKFVVENNLQDICLKDGQLDYYEKMENMEPRKRSDKKKIRKKG